MKITAVSEIVAASAVVSTVKKLEIWLIGS
jgi:hypothetical protein